MSATMSTSMSTSSLVRNQAISKREGMQPTCPTINQQFVLRRPNQWDRALHNDSLLWDRIQEAGGILIVTSPFRRKLLETGNWGQPWIEMPAGAVKFQPQGVLPLPADDAAPNLVLTLQVPKGYDGVIVGYTNLFAGTGFVEGSGDITWRIRINRRYPRNLGSILTSSGSLQQPLPLTPGGLRVYSNEEVTYWVNIAVGASARIGLPGSSNIICGLTGWFYPQQG